MTIVAWWSSGGFDMDDSQTVLKIGLPKGSMRNPDRHGYAGQILFGAGFFPDGYESTMHDNDITDIEFRNFPYFKGVGVESQRSPELLYDGKIDALIAGADWVKEFGLRGYPNEKVMDLSFGEVKIVVAVERATKALYGDDDYFEHVLDSLGADGTLLGASEYPFIAVEHLMSRPSYKRLFGDDPPLTIGITGQPDRVDGPVNKQVQIRHTIQQCEAELTRGANFIIECTQTGKSFEKQGIVPVDDVMDSQAGLYVSNKTKGNPLLMNLVGYLSWMLRDGSRRERAYNKDENVFIEANVPEEHLATVEKFIIKNGYCAIAPTETRLGGIEGMSAIKFGIPMGKWPMFTYDIWELNKKQTGKVMRDIRVVPVLKSLD
jgi:ATP phosphoribosyltransferase